MFQLRWRLIMVPAAALVWIACNDITAPTAMRRDPDGKISSGVTPSALGALDGSVYFSVCVGDGDGSGTVYRVDPNGGTAAALTSGDLVRVAPGGARLAVRRGTDMNILVTMDAGGGNERVLTSGPGFITALAWSPDGSKVAALYGSGQRIRVFDDLSGGGSAEVTVPRSWATSKLDWRGSTWAFVRDTALDPPPGYFTNGARIAVSGSAGSSSFTDLYTPTFLVFGSGVWNPVAEGSVRLDATGGVFWAGTNYQTNQQGIFGGAGTFRLNTGRTWDFAFSPNGDAIAAVRRTDNLTTRTSVFNLDIIDWSGPYVRTLYTTTQTAFSGAAICTVDWSRGVTQSPPLASIGYSGTGTANEFSFDGSGSIATTEGATIESYEWTFSDGTTASGTTVTHQFPSSGEHTATLKVIDSNGLDATASVTLTARLTIATVTTLPDNITVGETFSIRVMVRNDGGVALTNVMPTMSLDPTGLATIQSGPSPASATLDAGTQTTFVYDLKAIASGRDTAIVNASASAGAATINAQQRRRAFEINPAGIRVQLTVDVDDPEIGQEVTLTATLTNNGIVDLVNVSGTVTPDPSTGVTVTGPTPSTISRLAPGATADLVWKVKSASAGDLKLVVSASGTEDNTAALMRSGTSDIMITVADRRLIVTTTGDQPLPAQQLTDRICDVDLPTTGNQCTLRAALQLANALGGTQSIAFDIPGSEVPAISPQSALPAIQVALTLDGTTQSGGWIELSGAAVADSATGLLIDNGPAVVRGLVINGWKGAGIWVRSGANTVLTGNRIGTNTSGTESRPNGDGIRLNAPGVAIGGIAGTSPFACTGDCNLVSGNRRFGIWIGSRGGGTISGNWIGPDVTGLAPLPNGLPTPYSEPDVDADYIAPAFDEKDGGGVYITSEAANRPQPGTIMIGGMTVSPGMAPGNLMSGNNNYSVAIRGGLATQISGNLIGLDRTGSRMMPTSIGPGSRAGSWGVFIDPLSDFARRFNGSVPTQAVVGGSAGYGNVIAGFAGAGVQGFRPYQTQAGEATGSVSVLGNRIGTSADGVSAIPNLVGVAYATLANGNLVSGNVYGILGVRLVVGNRIGTDATGTRAIPNRAGVVNSDSVGGVRPTGSRSCTGPCNLISGNRHQAVYNSTIVHGNFIGTDISGMVGIPNGGGEWSGNIVLPTVVREIRQLGGESGAILGICDRACNLISGNAVTAVVAAFETTQLRVEGNVIGAAIDGGALGNAGPGVRAAVSALGPEIGGDGNLGNKIAHNSGPAVEILSAKTGPKILANSITGNSAGIVYAEGLPIQVPAVPVVSAVREGSATNVQLRLTDFASGSAFSARIDVFASTACEPGPQGAIPIGKVTLGLITDGTDSLVVQNLPEAASVITATSTINGVTSPFSQCAYVAVRAELSASATAGDDRVAVTSQDGFNVGGWAKLNGVAANAEWKSIKAFGSLIFNSPLAFDHAEGEAIEPAAAPPPAGWILGANGDTWSFGTSQTFSFSRARQITGGAATPTGRGMWAIDRSGSVYIAGDATRYGDASALLGKGEEAVSILGSAVGTGYLIVTSSGRVLPFGGATSLGQLAQTASQKSKAAVVAGTRSPGGAGYIVTTSCGVVTPFGETSLAASVSLSGDCDIIGAAIPNNGTGAWVLRADGRVHAIGGAPALGGVTGKFSKLVGIAAAGDGYIVAETNGKLHGFGTTTPTAIDVKGQAAALVQLMR